MSLTKENPEFDRMMEENRQADNNSYNEYEDWKRNLRVVLYNKHGSILEADIGGKGKKLLAVRKDGSEMWTNDLAIARKYLGCDEE